MRRRKFQIIGRTDQPGRLWLDLPGPPAARRFTLVADGRLSLVEHIAIPAGRLGHRMKKINMQEVDDPSMLAAALEVIPPNILARLAAGVIRTR